MAVLQPPLLANSDLPAPSFHPLSQLQTPPHHARPATHLLPRCTAPVTLVLQHQPHSSGVAGAAGAGAGSIAPLLL